MRMRLAAASFLVVSLSLPLSAQDVYHVSNQVTAPKVTSSPQPEYTPDGRLRRIQGTVMLEVDVLADGTVGTVALVRGLFPGLDESAAKTVKTWRFTPGTKDGKPVAVGTPVTVMFRLS
jgi:periplasmic protein TonB